MSFQGTMSPRYISHQSPGPARVQAPAGFTSTPGTSDEGNFLQALGTLDKAQERLFQTHNDKPGGTPFHQTATFLKGTTLTSQKPAGKNHLLSPYAHKPTVEPHTEDGVFDENPAPKAFKKDPEKHPPHEVVNLEACIQKPLPKEGTQPHEGMKPTLTTNHQQIPPHSIEEALTNTPYDFGELYPQGDFQAPYAPNKPPAFMAMAFTPFSTAGTTLLAQNVTMPLHNTLPLADMEAHAGMDEGEWSLSPQHTKGKNQHTPINATGDELATRSMHGALKQLSTEPSLEITTQSSHLANALTPHNRAENIAIMLNMADAFRANVQRRHTHFRIPVHHETWGDVEVHLSIGKDQSVTASFLTSSDTMMRLLNTHKENLEEILANAGLTCAPANFHVIRHKETNI